MTTSLTTLAKNVKMTCKPGAARLPFDKRDDWQKNANDYRITLSYQGRRMSFDYWQGTGITTDPKVGEVLDCLLSDAWMAVEEAFEDFCANTDFDEDSRKAYTSYLATVRQTNSLKRVLGSDFEAFLYAYRD